MPRRALPVLGLALAGVLAPPAHADVSGPEIVGFLNAQRAANGIPAGIAEDPQLSAGCAAHNAYGARNDVLTHEEDPAAPGYTPEGDQAGRTSVLYSNGGPWSATVNPFETAPIHLHQLLAPRIDRMGASETGGYGCATTQGNRGRSAPAADVTYTYPGDGAKNWPAAQTASEFPYTPGQQVGIAAGATTGPYLYAMFDGPDLRGFEAAGEATGSLQGPGGPVPVVVADNTTPGLEGYLPTGAELIPRTPLAPATRYTASVAAQVNGRRFAHSWRFTTAPGADPFTVRARRRAGRVVVKVKAAMDLTATARVAGARASETLAAGEEWTHRFDARRKPAAVKIVVLAAGGRFVVRQKV